MTVRTDAELVTARRIEEAEIRRAFLAISPARFSRRGSSSRTLIRLDDRWSPWLTRRCGESGRVPAPRSHRVSSSFASARASPQIACAGKTAARTSSNAIKGSCCRRAPARGSGGARQDTESDLEPRTLDFIAASMARATRAKRWRWSRYAASAMLLIGAAFGLYAFMQSRPIQQQRRLAVAYRLASQAELTRTSQPGLSALLAVESLARQPGVEGDRVRRSLMLLPELVSDREVAQITAVSGAPGTEVVEYRRDEGLRVVNLATNVASGWMLKSVATAGDLVLSSTHVTADGRG